MPPERKKGNVSNACTELSAKYFHLGLNKTLGAKAMSFGFPDLMNRTKDFLSQFEQHHMGAAIFSKEAIPGGPRARVLG